MFTFNSRPVLVRDRVACPRSLFATTRRERYERLVIRAKDRYRIARLHRPIGNLYFNSLVASVNQAFFEIVARKAYAKKTVYALALRRARAMHHRAR